jgi:hypothetical protein
MGSQVYLRVNGISITTVKIRHKLIGGAPIGDKELVIEDPVLGKFAIDDTFILEATFDRRKKWEIVSVKSFLSMLDSIEANS